MSIKYQVLIAITVPFFIHLFLAIYFYNSLSNLADVFSQTSYYEEQAIKAESGLLDNANNKLASLYRSVAQSDTELSQGLKLLAISMLFWVFVTIVTSAFQAMLFFKLKAMYASNQST